MVQAPLSVQCPHAMLQATAAAGTATLRLLAGLARTIAPRRRGSACWPHARAPACLLVAKLVDSNISTVPAFDLRARSSRPRLRGRSKHCASSVARTPWRSAVPWRLPRCHGKRPPASHCPTPRLHDRQGRSRGHVERAKGRLGLRRRVLAVDDESVQDVYAERKDG